MRSDRIPTPDVENVVSAIKKVPSSRYKVQQAQDRKAKPSLRKKPGGWIPQANTGQNEVHTVEQTNSDSDKLCFETIQIDTSNDTPVKDEAFAKLQVKLSNVINHPNCAQSESRYCRPRKYSAFANLSEHVSIPCG